MPDIAPFRIVVVGGADSGITAAIRSRHLDEHASITVIEKGPYVSHANSGVPYALDGLIETDTALVVQTPAGLKARFNLEVHINTELVSIARAQHTIAVHSQDTKCIYDLTYDKLILAQGAEPARLDIEGTKDAQNIFTLRTQKDIQAIRSYALKNESKRATVIGGGFIGLKAVENLHRLGLHVDLVEMHDQVYHTVDKDIAYYLQTELLRNGVQVFLQTRPHKIMTIDAEDYSYIELNNGSILSTDLIITAVGLNPRVSIAQEAGLTVKRGVTVNSFMQTSDPDIYAVGDMIETEGGLGHIPGTLALGGPGSRQGRIAANHIYGKASGYSGYVGTSLCKVFNLTVAITGMSVDRLRGIGYKPQWVTVRIPDHEGYYPSSSQLTLRASFEPYTGRLLGAQAVGKSGVDKRIDVLSTAIQAGMSVFELEQLELSYAPRYGPAKDPVNVAGYVACNVLRGDVQLIHPDQLIGHIPEWQVVDVRSAENFSQGHVPSSRNIPIDTLRKSLASIHKRLPVLVYSRVGYHGYIAYRILKQLGYQVANLDGGWKLFVSGGYQTIITS
ncbi:uncharacterized protein TRUGW13939_04858 [Talaromyces rugulosus]|uniref:Rhodanese domain-containing protein n=1 Tax=Talaromyces rugulosus TaxID=121627 RepID=A0A7H8QVH5_TALRU|nr:uncharacterized protein TRUGW13939_04858 [Talaromyces rugulosus]QKX57738.1 hypothetical protein TRUGW13939_04858 [Talaromyces rugulosus]